MDGSNLTDEQLLADALDGGEGAFAALYERRQAAVYRFALQMSGSPETAEDVTQEAFLALLGQGSRFDAGRGSVAGYLYGIARNRVRKWLEREGRAAPEAPEATDASCDSVDSLLRNENVRAVRAAVLELPPHYREAVVLCDLHETSYEEAAAILGCPVGTVRSRLHRGRALLAEKLRLGSETAPARSWA